MPPDLLDTLVLGASYPLVAPCPLLQVPLLAHLVPWSLCLPIPPWHHLPLAASLLDVQPCSGVLHCVLCHSFRGLLVWSCIPFPFLFFAGVLPFMPLSHWILLGCSLLVPHAPCSMSTCLPRSNLTLAFPMVLRRKDGPPRKRDLPTWRRKDIQNREQGVQTIIRARGCQIRICGTTQTSMPMRKQLEGKSGQLGGILLTNFLVPFPAFSCMTLGPPSPLGIVFAPVWGHFPALHVLGRSQRVFLSAGGG